ncbi:MAG TPA: hypothetical protein PKC89_06880 [Pyrinomonadaceae bacterium]|nr:hypothetical protein [Pyrinomonadaceae bacterium]
MTGDRLKFSDVFSVLNDMRAKGVIGKYAVGGASAVAFYAEPIATKDLDIFFLFEPPQETAILSLESIYKYCRENGLTYDHEFISIRGWLVQFVECGNDPLWRDALANAIRFSFEGGTIDVLSPEHLAAMWAVVARPKDILKIQHFAESGVLDPDRLKEILVRFDLLNTWQKMQGGLSDECRF